MWISVFAHSCNLPLSNKLLSFPHTADVPVMIIDYFAGTGDGSSVILELPCLQHGKILLVICSPPTVEQITGRGPSVIIIYGGVVLPGPQPQPCKARPTPGLTWLSRRVTSGPYTPVSPPLPGTHYHHHYSLPPPLLITITTTTKHLPTTTRCALINVTATVVYSNMGRPQPTGS